jgi:hypothetical protein
LAAPAISKAFFFIDSSASNVLSLIVLVDLTFSLAAFVVLKAFYFVSSIVEPTFYFAFPTLY